MKGMAVASQEPFPRPRVLVFDIGNVLVSTDTARFIGRLKSLFDEDTEFFKAIGKLKEMDERYGLGLMTTDEFMHMAGQELSLEHDDLVSLCNDLFIERSYIVPFLEELRDQGYVLAVCSNTNEIHVKYLLSAYPCFSLLHHLIFSYHVHAYKPSSAIYRAVEDATERAPFEHLFLDDLYENVVGARERGWDAICWSDPEQVQKEL